MAASMFMSFVRDLPPCDTEQYLDLVSSFVSENKFMEMPLTKPAGATLAVCELEDTIYVENQEEVKNWGQFYLPDIVNMRVVGVVKGMSCPGGQLVLMTCENKKVYGFDGEELHVVASDLGQVVHDRKIDYPASESYEYGDAFKDMDEADWEKVKKLPAGRRLDQDFNRMVQQHKEEFMQSLKSSAHL